MFKNIFPNALYQLMIKTWDIPVVTPHMCMLSSIENSLPWENSSNSFKGWLTPQEQKQLAGYKLTKRKHEWLAGRICAKAAIKAYNQAFCKDVDLAKSYAIIVNQPSGRPMVDDDRNTPSFPKLDISISHSKELAVAMAADAYCGIDIQFCTDKLAITKDHFCTTDEMTILTQRTSLQDTIMQLAILWTAKEAIKKALSHQQMPGFLDLSLTSIEELSQGLRLTFTSNKKTFPHTLQVVAAQFETYGIGICIS